MHEVGTDRFLRSGVAPRSSENGAVGNRWGSMRSDVDGRSDDNDSRYATTDAGA